MSENLHKIWAKSERLDEYFATEIEKIELGDYPLSHEIEVNKTNKTAQLLDNASKAIWLTHNESERRKKALDSLRNQLVSAELILVGRTKSTDGEFQIILLEEQFWIGALIEPELNSAELSGQEVDQLRIYSDGRKVAAAHTQISYPQSPPHKVTQSSGTANPCH